MKRTGENKKAKVAAGYPEQFRHLLNELENPMAKKSVNSYYTDGGVAIDQRIKDGRTKLFNTKLEAEAFARVKRSSVYQVFNERKKPIAWAVPN